MSKALGNRTVLSGSISRRKNDPSQSLQMMIRPLMSPHELKTLPKGHLVLVKRGNCPMQTRLPLFLKWGIQFENTYEVPEQSARAVKYVDRFELEQEIIRRRDIEEANREEYDVMPVPAEKRMGGQQHIQMPTAKEHSSTPKRPPLRTD